MSQDQTQLGKKLLKTIKLNKDTLSVSLNMYTRVNIMFTDKGVEHIEKLHNMKSGSLSRDKNGYLSYDILSFFKDFSTLINTLNFDELNQYFDTKFIIPKSNLIMSGNSTQQEELYTRDQLIQFAEANIYNQNEEIGRPLVDKPMSKYTYDGVHVRTSLIYTPNSNFIVPQKLNRFKRFTNYIGQAFKILFTGKSSNDQRDLTEENIKNKQS